jgi:hypothetical protein
MVRHCSAGPNSLPALNDRARAGLLSFSLKEPPNAQRPGVIVTALESLSATMPPALRHVLDALASLVGIMFAMANTVNVVTLLTVIWWVLRIFEMATVQRLLRRFRKDTPDELYHANPPVLAVWHVRLAAIFAVLSGAVVSQPNILGGLVPYVPPYWRPAAGAIVGVIVFALPTYLKRGKRAANG